MPETVAKKYLFSREGGRFADLIRYYRKKIPLSAGLMHKIALAALDQNAYLIAGLCKCRYVSSLKQAKSIKTGIAVIAPYQILAQEQPFSRRNLAIDILSSDSSAIYFTHLLEAKFIIAMDVDGVYERNPKSGRRRPKLLKEIDTTILVRIFSISILLKPSLNRIFTVKIKILLEPGRPQRF